jgi:hypothetical protein
MMRIVPYHSYGNLERVVRARKGGAILLTAAAA